MALNVPMGLTGAAVPVLYSEEDPPKLLSFLPSTCTRDLWPPRGLMLCVTGPWPILGAPNQVPVCSASLPRYLSCQVRVEKKIFLVCSIPT